MSLEGTGQVTGPHTDTQPHKLKDHLETGITQRDSSVDWRRRRRKKKALTCSESTRSNRPEFWKTRK